MTINGVGNEANDKKLMKIKQIATEQMHLNKSYSKGDFPSLNTYDCPFPSDFWVARVWVNL